MAMETIEYRLFSLIRLHIRWIEEFNNSKGDRAIVESSTASSDFTKDSTSMTLIEGHEMRTTCLNQRKVKFTSRTPVCISSSHIKHQLDSVNYSWRLVYRTFQWLCHQPAVLASIHNTSVHFFFSFFSIPLFDEACLDICMYYDSFVYRF